jgi:Tfp pilus assembly protein PilV
MQSKRREQGFSYIDLIISITIMMIGILALTGAVMANLVRSYDTDKQAIAKQLALSTIESIFSARDIQRPDGVKGWDSIGNVGSNIVSGVPQGIFMTGWRPIREEEGADGVFGTADDACNAGAPCQVGSYVNSSTVVKGYDRQIVITDVQESVNEPIKKRQVTVTVRYLVNRGTRTETMSTLISLYQ